MTKRTVTWTDNISKKLLAILIPTMNRRAPFLSRLLGELLPQVQPIGEPIVEPGPERSTWTIHLGADVGVFILDDDHMNNDRAMTIGQKRNHLVDRVADFDYLVHVDDDDLVSMDYVAKHREALRSAPDVVGIQGTMIMRELYGIEPLTVHEQRFARLFYHSIEIKDWYERNGVFFRSSNHLNATKTSIARQVPYKNRSFGEDRDYSERVKPLLLRETKIPESIYLYLFRKHKPELA